MKKNEEEVKKAKTQKDFATDPKADKKRYDLVIEHPQTKPDAAKKQNP